MQVVETPRLRIRRFDARDGAFIVDLLSQPSWIRFIGDKGVKTHEDALRYLEHGPLAMYRRVGFGLYAVELKETGHCIGMCGLIKRESLPDVDLGFALLPSYWHNGYAFEAATAVLSYGKESLGLGRIVAIVSKDNDRSRRLLERLGFHHECAVTLRPNDDELDLYALAD